MTKRKSMSNLLKPEEETFLQTGRAGGVHEPPPALSGAAQVPMSTEQLLAVLPALPDNALAPLNVRVDPFIARGLMQAAMVRKFQQQAPWTQREIVSDALEDWLRKHGYLK
jgi:hypothetical protein